ncbi:hypothetical protein DPMN_193028 [Dreissena polymorpha]|uniref:Uncharacterized protein n=1 Tax=Dreissena polymorpha TaxID=45954 RepID=A0A9D4BDU6_DREPO|nr:hypothetical protein DPMN_193028 [Dreissena polymorpha]
MSPDFLSKNVLRRSCVLVTTIQKDSNDNPTGTNAGQHSLMDRKDTTTKAMAGQKLRS